MPVILGSSQAHVFSDLNGLASLVPSAGSVSGALEIEVVASVGTSATQQFEVEALWPVATAGGSGTTGAAPAATKPSTGAVAVRSPGLPEHDVSAAETWSFASQSAMPSTSAACGNDENNAASDQQDGTEARAPVADCAHSQDSKSEANGDETAAKE
jgi:hypothetical protein